MFPHEEKGFIYLTIIGFTLKSNASNIIIRFYNLRRGK